MKRSRLFSALLAVATSLLTAGPALLAPPFAQAETPAPGLRVLGSPEKLRGSGLYGDELKTAIEADLETLQGGGVAATSVQGSDVVSAPDIAEHPIAILPATATSSDSWNGLTDEAVDASGRRYVVWLDERDQASFPFFSSVYFARSLDGGTTWSTPVRIDNPAGGAAFAGFGLNIAADPNGNVSVVWDDERSTGAGGMGQLFYTRSTDAGATWTTPAALVDEGRLFFFGPFADLAFDGDGNLNVAWMDLRASGPFGPTRVYNMHSSDRGATWSPNAIIDHSSGADVEFAPTIVTGRTGDFMIGWSSSRAGGAGEDLYVARSTDGGATFAAETRMGTEGAGSLNLNEFDLCSDGNGSVYAFWQTDDPSTGADNGTARYRTSSDFGATFAAPGTLTSDAEIGVSTANGCSFGSSYAVVVWQDISGGYIAATSRDGGVVWTLARINTLSPYPCGFCDLFEVTADVDAQGRVVVAWTDDQNVAPDAFLNYSLDGGTTWQSTFFKVTNELSGSTTVTLTDGAIGAPAFGQNNANANDRLVYNMSYYDMRAGAQGLYSATATFEGTKTSMKRDAGSDRYKTNVAIMQDQFPTAGTVSTAVFASGENFPDGLSATTLAAMVNGPLYLVRQGTLPSEVAADFLRVYDKKSDAKVDVYVVGGTAAISASVESAIKSLDPSITTKRLAGSNRKATSVEVAKEEDVLRGRGPTQAFMARGSAFADALTAGAAGGNTGIQNDFSPVLLTDTGSLDPTVMAYLTSVSSTLATLHVVGGTAAVSASTAAAADAVVANVARHAGATRYSTATQMATDFYKGTLAPQTFGLASGAVFADALPGGLWAALHLSPLLLSTPTALSTETADYLKANAATIDSGTAFGGTAALGQAVLDEAAALY